MLGAVDWPPGMPGLMELTKPTPALLTSAVEKRRDGNEYLGTNLQDVLRSTCVDAHIADFSCLQRSSVGGTRDNRVSCSSSSER